MMGKGDINLIRSRNQGLPGETGDSQTDANGFPDLPSMRIGNQYNDKYAPTSSSDGVYDLVNTYSKRITHKINKHEMCSFEFFSTSSQS